MLEGVQEKWEGIKEKVGLIGGISTWLEQHGIPSLAGFAIILLLLGVIGFFAYTQVLTPKTADLIITVYADDGITPVSNAAVSISSSDQDFKNQYQTTDPNGRATFQALPAGDYSLSVSSDTYSFVDKQLAVIPGKANADSFTAQPSPAQKKVKLQVNIDGPEHASITVLDRGGVIADSGDYPLKSTFYLDSNSTYSIRAKEDGYDSPPDQVKQLGSVDDSITIKLVPSGAAPTSLLHVGVFDQNSAPIANAKIEVRDQAGKLITSTSSGADGTGDAMQINTGSNVSITADAPGFEEGLLSRNITLSDENVKFNLLTAIPDNVIIGVVDQNNAQVSNALVSLYRDKAEVEDAHSDETGSVTFNVTKKSLGSYAVTVTKPSYLPAVLRKVSLGAQSMVLKPANDSNSGVVRVVVQDAEGKEVEGASVSLRYGDGLPLGIGDRITGADGTQNFYDIPFMSLKAVAAFQGRKVEGDVVDVTAGGTPGENATLIQLSFPAERRTVTITATDEKGNAVADALASLSNAQGNSTCLTQANGKCFIRALEGNYVAGGSASGFANSASFNFTVKGQDNLLSIVMMRTQALEQLFPSLVFLGLFDSSGKEVRNVLRPGTVYQARYLLPSSSGDFTKAIAHIRIGDVLNTVDEEKAGIIDFNAIGATRLSAGTDYSTAQSPSSVQDTSNTEVFVQVGDNGFLPNAIRVEQGGTVSWENIGSGNHTVIADGGAFSSPVLVPGGKFSFKFDSTGNYSYRDSQTQGIAGSVLVTQKSSPIAQQSAQAQFNKWAEFEFPKFTGVKELLVKIKTKLEDSGNITLNHRTAFTFSNSTLRNPPDADAGSGKPELTALTTRSAAFQLGLNDAVCDNGFCLQAYFLSSGSLKQAGFQAAAGDSFSIQFMGIGEEGGNGGALEYSLTTESKGVRIDGGSDLQAAVTSNEKGQAIVLKVNEDSNGISKGFIKFDAVRSSKDVQLVLQVKRNNQVVAEKTLSMSVFQQGGVMRVSFTPKQVKALEESTLQFNVTDSRGNPIDNARIVLGSSSDSLSGQTVEAAATDKEGTYQANVQVSKLGGIEFTISAEGFRKFTGVIDVLPPISFMDVSPKVLDLTANTNAPASTPFTIQNNLDNTVSLTLSLLPASVPQFTDVSLDTEFLKVKGRESGQAQLQARISNSLLLIAEKAGTKNEKLSGKVKVKAVIGKVAQEATIPYSISSTATQPSLDSLWTVGTDTLSFELKGPNELTSTQFITVTNDAAYPLIINQEVTLNKVTVTPLSQVVPAGQTSSFKVVASAFNDLTGGDKCVFEDAAQKGVVTLYASFQGIKSKKVFPVIVNTHSSDSCAPVNGYTISMPVGTQFTFPPQSLTKQNDDGSTAVQLPNKERMLFYNTAQVNVINAKLSRGIPIEVSGQRVIRNGNGFTVTFPVPADLDLPRNSILQGLPDGSVQALSGDAMIILPPGTNIIENTGVHFSTEKELFFETPTTLLQSPERLAQVPPESPITFTPLAVPITQFNPNYPPYYQPGFGNFPYSIAEIMNQKTIQGVNQQVSNGKRITLPIPITLNLPQGSSEIDLTKLKSLYETTLPSSTQSAWKQLLKPDQINGKAYRLPDGTAILVPSDSKTTTGAGTLNVRVLQDEEFAVPTDYYTPVSVSNPDLQNLIQEAFKLQFPFDAVISYPSNSVIQEPTDDFPGLYSIKVSDNRVIQLPFNPKGKGIVKQGGTTDLQVSKGTELTVLMGGIAGDIKGEIKPFCPNNPLTFTSNEQGQITVPIGAKAKAVDNGIRVELRECQKIQVMNENRQMLYESGKVISFVAQGTQLPPDYSPSNSFKLTLGSRSKITFTSCRDDNDKPSMMVQVHLPVQGTFVLPDSERKNYYPENKEAKLSACQKITLKGLEGGDLSIGAAKYLKFPYSSVEAIGEDKKIIGVSVPSTNANGNYQAVTFLPCCEEEVAGEISVEFNKNFFEVDNPDHPKQPGKEPVITIELNNKQLTNKAKLSLFNKGSTEMQVKLEKIIPGNRQDDGLLAEAIDQKLTGVHIGSLEYDTSRQFPLGPSQKENKVEPTEFDITAKVPGGLLKEFTPCIKHGATISGELEFTATENVLKASTEGEKKLQLDSTATGGSHTRTATIVIRVNPNVACANEQLRSSIVASLQGVIVSHNNTVLGSDGNPTQFNFKNSGQERYFTITNDLELPQAVRIQLFPGITQPMECSVRDGLQYKPLDGYVVDYGQAALVKCTSKEVISQSSSYEFDIVGTVTNERTHQKIAVTVYKGSPDLYKNTPIGELAPIDPVADYPAASQATKSATAAKEEKASLEGNTPPGNAQPAAQNTPTQAQPAANTPATQSSPTQGSSNAEVLQTDDVTVCTHLFCNTAKAAKTYVSFLGQIRNVVDKIASAKTDDFPSNKDSFCGVHEVIPYKKTMVIQLAQGKIALDLFNSKGIDSKWNVKRGEGTLNQFSECGVYYVNVQIENACPKQGNTETDPAKWKDLVQLQVTGSKLVDCPVNVANAPLLIPADDYVSKSDFMLFGGGDTSDTYYPHRYVGKYNPIDDEPTRVKLDSQDSKNANILAKTFYGPSLDLTPAPLSFYDDNTVHGAPNADGNCANNLNPGRDKLYATWVVMVVTGQFGFYPPVSLTPWGATLRRLFYNGFRIPIAYGACIGTGKLTKQVSWCDLRNYCDYLAYVMTADAIADTVTYGIASRKTTTPPSWKEFFANAIPAGTELAAQLGVNYGAGFQHPAIAYFGGKAFQLGAGFLYCRAHPTECGAPSATANALDKLPGTASAAQTTEQLIKSLQSENLIGTEARLSGRAATAIKDAQDADSRTLMYNNQVAGKWIIQEDGTIYQPKAIVGNINPTGIRIPAQQFIKSKNGALVPSGQLVPNLEITDASKLFEPAPAPLTGGVIAKPFTGLAAEVQAPQQEPTLLQKATPFLQWGIPAFGAFSYIKAKFFNKAASDVAGKSLAAGGLNWITNNPTVAGMMGGLAAGIAASIWFRVNGKPAQAYIGETHYSMIVVYHSVNIHGTFENNVDSYCFYEINGKDAQCSKRSEIPAQLDEKKQPLKAYFKLDVQEATGKLQSQVNLKRYALLAQLNGGDAATLLDSVFKPDSAPLEAKDSIGMKADDSTTKLQGTNSAFDEKAEQDKTLQNIRNLALLNANAIISSCPKYVKDNSKPCNYRTKEKIDALNKAGFVDVQKGTLNIDQNDQAKMDELAGIVLDDNWAKQGASEADQAASQAQQTG